MKFEFKYQLLIISAKVQENDKIFCALSWQDICSIMTLTSPTVMVQASFCRKWWLKWKLYSMFQNQRTAFPHLTAPLIYWKRAMVNIPIFILCLPAQPSARWLPTVTNRQTGRRCSRPTSFCWPVRMQCERIALRWIGYWWGWTQFLRAYWHWLNTSKTVIFTSNLSGHFNSMAIFGGPLYAVSLKQLWCYRFYFPY